MSLLTGQYVKEEDKDSYLTLYLEQNDQLMGTMTHLSAISATYT